MSTVERPEIYTLPPLVDGERLDRATFHDRYSAMPPETRAELIGGVVYMGSPLGLRHGRADCDAIEWINYYRRHTKGVQRASNATAMFGDYGEPQPDLLVYLPEELGGQSRVVDGYLVGPPELVVEVSLSTRKKDLGPKKKDYERAGVLEYVFVGLAPSEVRWFVRRVGKFIPLKPDPDGLYRSAAFPGLWLDPKALLAGDTEAILAAVDLGLATPEHAAFAASLAEAAGRA